MEHTSPANRLFWKDLGIRFLFVISVLFSHELTAQEKTPLHVAASGNNLATLNQLIDQGAQIEARDKIGQTPLMLAAVFSSTPEIVQLLIDKGANALTKCKAGKKAIDYAKENEKLVGTQAYWNLHNKSFE